jgi:hypothetical protein
VVGGTRGHGRAWVRALCAKGHKVSVLGRRAPSDTDRGLPGVRFFRADLSKPTGLQSLLTKIAKHGPLDTLAFFQRLRGAGDSWDAELAVTLTATNRFIEFFKRRFAKDGARAIVAVGSAGAAFVAAEQPAGYHVAKAGLKQLVRYHAVALAPLGLRVNLVSPGAMIKEESAAFWASQKKLTELYGKVIPRGRMGTSKDVAGAVDFLCGPHAAFVTGQDLVVDGGLSLLWQESLARQVSPLAGRRVTRK